MKIISLMYLLEVNTLISRLIDAFAIELAVPFGCVLSLVSECYSLFSIVYLFPLEQYKEKKKTMKKNMNNMTNSSKDADQTVMLHNLMPVLIQWATISPPAKRHLNVVSLAGG